MKVAVIRGFWLNPFEMQYYEPLKRYYDITAFTTRDHVFDIGSVNLPIVTLRSARQIGMGIPKFQGLCDRIMRRILGSEFYNVGLTKQLKGFDIVHSVEAHNIFSYQALKAKRQYGAKIVLTVNENIPFIYMTDPFLKEIKMRILDEADFFIAVTERSKRSLLLEGAPEKKIEVIGHGLDVDRFRPGQKEPSLMKELGLSADHTVILFVGQLIWSKGVYDFVSAAASLLRDESLRKPRLKFLLAGKGKEEKPLRNLIARLNLDNQVSLVRTRSYSEMEKLHNLADIFVLPSIPIETWREQFGMVLIESMACGKPVVSTYCGAIPEVVGNAGVLVPPADPFGLAEAIRTLILDPQLRDELGRRGRERVVENWDAQKVSERIRHVYESL